MGPTDNEKAIRNGLMLLSASLRQEVDAMQVRAYLRGLRDIPAAIITDAADRLATTPGRRFFPTVPEWIGACADIVEAKRSSAARLAKALQDECPDCQGSGWANAEGPNAVIKCRCVKRGLELIADAGQAISRPALPAHDPEVPA